MQTISDNVILSSLVTTLEAFFTARWERDAQETLDRRPSRLGLGEHKPLCHLALSTRDIGFVNPPVVTRRLFTSELVGIDFRISVECHVCSKKSMISIPIMHNTTREKTEQKRIWPCGTYC